MNASHVKRGKPDPEIFFKAAASMRLLPSQCVVFEDSLLGIEAARRAGMKVIALATMHKKKELGHADMVEKDFSKLHLHTVRSVLPAR